MNYAFAKLDSLVTSVAKNVVAKKKAVQMMLVINHLVNVYANQNFMGGHVIKIVVAI